MMIWNERKICEMAPRKKAKAKNVVTTSKSTAGAIEKAAEEIKKAPKTTKDKVSTDKATVETKTVEKTVEKKKAGRPKAVKTTKDVPEKKEDVKAEKVTAEKKPAGRKTAAKKAKSEISYMTHIQFAGKDFTEETMMGLLKADWKANKHKLADLKNVELYVKPEESKVYYVVNENETGSFDI